VSGARPLQGFCPGHFHKPSPPIGATSIQSEFRIDDHSKWSEGLSSSYDALIVEFPVLLFLSKSRSRPLSVILLRNQHNMENDRATRTIGPIVWWESTILHTPPVITATANVTNAICRTRAFSRIENSIRKAMNASAVAANRMLNSLSERLAVIKHPATPGIPTQTALILRSNRVTNNQFLLALRAPASNRVQLL
jgi:hypothetical protein